MNATPLLVQSFLLYFILPLWIAAGVGDWLCHRATRISRTSGIGEALLHIAMVVEIGVPLLLALLFDINALILAIMLAALVIHEATGFWDLVYAHRSTREVRPIEQHVHSFQEVLPWMAVAVVVLLNWDQFLALLGVGRREADFALRFKSSYWQAGYGTALVIAAFLLSVLPFAEECWRCLRRRGEPAQADDVTPRPARTYTAG